MQGPPVKFRTLRGSKTRIVYIHKPSSLITTVSAMCNVGSCQEDPDVFGAAHFLEHMLFKGTELRSQSNQISDELDSLGAQFNAYTDKYVTSFEVKVNSKYAREAIDILSDMLCNSTLPESTVETEKKVVMEENNISMDSPKSFALNKFIEQIFEGHPLAHNIGGTNEIVSRYNRDKTYKFYKDHYKTNNFVISICTNLSLTKIRSYLSRSHFAQTVSTGSGPHHPTIQPILAQNKPRISVYNREMEQAHILVGFPCHGLFHRDRYALKILAYILAGGLSSRLFTDLRIKNGLSYSIGMDTMFYPKNGCLLIMTSFSKNRVLNSRKEVGGLPLIFQNLVRIRSENVSNEELQKAKNILIGQYMFHIESSQSLSDYYARQELFKHFNNNTIESLDDVVKQYETVSVKDIRRMARKYFVFHKCNIVILGSKHTEKHVHKSLRQYLQQ